ncbi:uncharacterized protein KY384_006217 [Bacidia gigantensis]|uniref:uncharacterized protein n=1 Tax=Bacidia gigantensis TaxID=2732470 RepID=UPI001D05621D|nr:uncharacterized protein KY384_006217 [Bacidia gigantensis]KAG8529580.1 hypothetical protein KY384_006217 [Bacidia gigantensis]
MDISSLLSPQESPTATPPPAAKSHAKKTLKPRGSRSSNLNHSANTSTPHNLPQNAPLQSQALASSPPNGSPVPGHRLSVSSTPSADGGRAYRQPSTAGMDTLADLASMQHHQQTARANATGMRSAETLVATALPSLQNMTRSEATSRLRAGSFDVTMTDSPQLTPTPRIYFSKALSESDLQTITEAGNHILQNPFSSDSYTQLINLLHKGLLSHIRLQSSSKTSGDPHSYELLRDLQSAREAMSARFAIGEDLWADWIQDRILLATSFEDKLSIKELCEKAVNEEDTSSKIWLIYGQWMLSECHRLSSREERAGTARNGHLTPDEERVMAAELFGWQQVLSTWQRATQGTMWRINDSHQLWDQYTDLLLQDLQAMPQRPQPEAIARMQHWFMNRLQIPHATWDQTSQKLSTFMSTHDNANWEPTMVTANRIGAEAKHKYEMRDFKEINVLRASQKGDSEAEVQAFSEYIDYEMSLSRKKNSFSVELTKALYQRALLRFPARTQLWESYIMFLNEEIAHHAQQDLPMLSVLYKATRHCPWSGTLWAHYMLAAEIADVPFTDISDIKHKATSSGISELNEIDELLKVTTAWCNYLRRRAFKPGSTDEEIDVAEVGIRSAIEDVENVGRKKYGRDYPGDSEYRLEKIYIKYLSQARNWHTARETFRKLIPRKGHDYDFWLRFYVWEMITWSKLSYDSNADTGRFTRPAEATKALQQAMRRNDLDWPEKIVQTYLHHCEDHEDAPQLQSAHVDVWKQNQVIQERRAEGSLVQQQQQSQSFEASKSLVDGDETDVLGKRKRVDDVEEAPSKKTRPDEIPSIEPQIQEQSLPEPSLLKRDREHATVIVKNLPVDTTETRVRQYFRDCGKINSLKLLPEDERKSMTAFIEFESKEDVLTAQTKDMKTFDGNDIEVQVGSDTTLYVCNFPPAADEAWIRDKFDEHGEIVDIRFPSLKYNTHRRFAYVQFKLSSQAQSAAVLDGQTLDGDLKLVAKISNPALRQKRQGAMYEGREVFVMNIPSSANWRDLKQFFSQHGYVDSARIPKKFNGVSKGFGFVVYRDKEGAEKCLALDGSEWQGRTISVTPSTSDTSQRQNEIVASRSQQTTASPSADISALDEDANRATSPGPAADPSKKREIQSRTFALLNIPDTVNEARMRKLTEPHGKLIRLILRPDHQGAIIEYAEQASVGKASLALEGWEIHPGRKLKVGTLGDLKEQKAEKKYDKIPTGPKKNVTLPISSQVRRPGIGAGRRGGKGGLGLKKSGVGLDGDRAKSNGQKVEEERGNDEEEGGDGQGDRRKEQVKPKSNADFKALLLGG